MSSIGKSSNHSWMVEHDTRTRLLNDIEHIPELAQMNQESNSSDECVLSFYVRVPDCTQHILRQCFPCYPIRELEAVRDGATGALRRVQDVTRQPAHQTKPTNMRLRNCCKDRRKTCHKIIFSSAG